MQFYPITLKDRALILQYQDLQEMPLSDFNFTNLWIWRFAREISLAKVKDCLVIRTQYPNQEPYYFFPLGDNANQALDILLQKIPSIYFKSLNAKQAQILSQNYGFETFANRDRFDYVYNIAELITLGGRKYHKKKNHLNKFLQTYPQFCFEEVNQSNKEELLQTYQQWFEANPNQDEALLAEKRGIESILQDLDYLAEREGLFSLKGGLLRVDGEIIAFSFAEAISNQSIVVHIEKANTRYLGAYQAINQQFLSHLWGDYLWVNREEDLGIEGLRKAKLSYQPIHLLEKYEAKR